MGCKGRACSRCARNLPSPDFAAPAERDTPERPWKPRTTADGRAADAWLGHFALAVAYTPAVSLGPAHYFVDLAAAYARGCLGLPVETDADTALGRAVVADLRLHRFKRNASLPRVARVLGILRGLAPESLLDVGSGRGTFLWPMLEAFTETRVLAVDRDPGRVRGLGAVARGGCNRLVAARMDAGALALADGAVDVVTVLEVLEHLAQPERAAGEAVRVARRAVVATVPSKEDDNPEHIQLFDGGALGNLLRDAGARSVNIAHVLNHIVAVATVS